MTSREKLMPESPLTAEEIEQLRRAIRDELDMRPPTIALVGVSGVGKSSTINTLFKTQLETSDTVACTKEFWDLDVELSFTSGQVKNQSVKLRVIDAPGLGEDISRDPGYIKMYLDNLDRCDVIVWILAARNRAIALDQAYLQRLSSFSSKMVFGLNQVDLIEPLNWNTLSNLPSNEQEHNIQEIEKDRLRKIQSVIERDDIKLIPYSAKARYHLPHLFTAIVTSCEPERAWVFESLKNFQYDDWLTDEARDEAHKELKKRQKEEKKQQEGSFIASIKRKLSGGEGGKT